MNIKQDFLLRFFNPHKLDAAGQRWETVLNYEEKKCLYVLSLLIAKFGYVPGTYWL